MVIVLIVVEAEDQGVARDGLMGRDTIDPPDLGRPQGSTRKRKKRCITARPKVYPDVVILDISSTLR